MCCFWPVQAWRNNDKGVPVTGQVGRCIGCSDAVLPVGIGSPLDVEGKEHSPLWAEMQ